MDFLKQLAPTIASALLGPMAGVAVSALGNLLGVDSPTQEKISEVIRDGKLTPDQLSAIQQLELKYQAEEKERGFRYTELEFKDRDSARRANVDGGIQGRLFVMSIILLVLTIGTEVWVLFNGYPSNVPDVIAGRVLGLMDAVAMLVLAYYYGTTSNSNHKTMLIAGAGASR